MPVFRVPHLLLLVQHQLQTHALTSPATVVTTITLSAKPRATSFPSARNLVDVAMLTSLPTVVTALTCWFDCGQMNDRGAKFVVGIGAQMTSQSNVFML